MSRRTGDTRERILDIAREQFGNRGYTGTSIADISAELGTTPAALYYHFRSKADILSALVAEPMAAYERLAERAAGHSSPADLLAAFLDFTVETRSLMPIVNSDPAVRAIIDGELKHRPDEIFAAVLAGLAGPRPSRAAKIRARAAFAVVKEATLGAISGDALRPADRAEILAAATRALDSGVTQPM
jgi:AcrR family transcriptional regulator